MSTESTPRSLLVSSCTGQIIEDLLRRLDEVPEEIRQTVREQGGGHANHQFLWKVIGPPRGTTPQGALANARERDFGLDAFKERFAAAAAKQSDSGWAFLVINPSTRKLEILAAKPGQCLALRSTATIGVRRVNRLVECRGVGCRLPPT